MSTNYHFDPLVLSSSCSSTNSLIKFASRLGATIDPDFLYQCQISDPKIEKKIDDLKSVPLVFETPLSVFENQEDIYLDMDAPDFSSSYFSDPWQFREYNAWAETSDQWNFVDAAPTEDLRIEFF